MGVYRLSPEHSLAKRKARKQAAKQGHLLTRFQQSDPLQTGRPYYWAVCKKCGGFAVVRPRPWLFDKPLDGDVFVHKCPGAARDQ